MRTYHACHLEDADLPHAPAGNSSAPAGRRRLDSSCSQPALSLCASTGPTTAWTETPALASCLAARLRRGVGATVKAPSTDKDCYDGNEPGRLRVWRLYRPAYLLLCAGTVERRRWQRAPGPCSKRGREGHVHRGRGVTPGLPRIEAECGSSGIALFSAVPPIWFSGGP